MRIAIVRRSGGFVATLDLREAGGRVLWSRPPLVESDCRRRISSASSTRRTGAGADPGDRGVREGDRGSADARAAGRRGGVPAGSIRRGAGPPRRFTPRDRVRASCRPAHQADLPRGDLHGDGAAGALRGAGRAGHGRAHARRPPDPRRRSGGGRRAPPAVVSSPQRSPGRLQDAGRPQRPPRARARRAAPRAAGTASRARTAPR